MEINFWPFIFQKKSLYICLQVILRPQELKNKQKKPPKIKQPSPLTKKPLKLVKKYQVYFCERSLFWHLIQDFLI